MHKYFTLLFFFFAATCLNAQDVFQRASTIHTLDYLPGGGGFGNIIAGVDWDKDGRPDLYTVSANYIDTRPGELIPKIYKFEWNSTTATWDSVWGATLAGQAQNTWIGLAWGDLDKDGKPELIWCPSNYPDPSDVAPELRNPNPKRIIVYEVVGDGSDNLGVDDGFGGWLPNASTTLVDEDDYNLRPLQLKVMDFDSDGTDEIIFCDQATSWHYGVVSVDNIPDNGDGSETWTVEANGANDPILSNAINTWDIDVIGNTLYLFDQTGLIYPVKYENGTYTTMPALTNVAGETGSFKGSVTADLDNDGIPEIVLGGWSDDQVYVLKQVADTLQTFDVGTCPGAGRLNGAAAGDLDNDGHPDFVFGTRSASTPNNAVYRVEFEGGDISDPANYQVSVIDSLLVPAPGGTGGQLDVFYVANVDGDPADEVLYTQGYTRGVANDTTADMAILDIEYTPLGVKLVDNKVPDQFYLNQNYPNPFNPATTIEFGLRKESVVELKLYNVLGQEVATLISGQLMKTGTYNINFKASNLASGTYIYRLKAGETVLSKKMLLLK
jgi:hypothetical protein